MKVADVMTRGVISIPPGASMREAAKRLLQYDVGGFPVLDGGRLVGMITESDFLRRPETGTARLRPRWLEGFVDPGRLAADYARAHGRKVDEVMTRDVVTVSPEAPLEQAVELMQQYHIKRLPVLQNGGMVGIISRSDLLHAFVVGSHEAAPLSDVEIRARLRAELEAQPWAPSGTVDIVVNRGKVELYGTITDERQRAALRIAAENIAGVREVRDHLERREGNDAVVSRG
jgi:CBS-domain-containing membrane protein